MPRPASAPGCSACDSYDVTLDLTRGDEVFGSASVIRFGCREPGAASYVDLIAAGVHEITLNGVPVDRGRCGARARPDRAPAPRRRERAAGGCRLPLLGRRHGAAPGGRPRRRQGRTRTRSWPAYARRVYANFDQPDLKACSRSTSPPRQLDRAVQPARARAGPGRRAGRSVVALPAHAADLDLPQRRGRRRVPARARRRTPRPAGQMIPLGIACRAVAAPLTWTPTRSSRSPGRVWTSIPGCSRATSRSPSTTRCSCPSYSVGATENVGCVVISDELLFRSRVTSALHELRAMVILHEMAHMWFGNLVTMKWWDDLWLNESFAEFCGTLASAEATRFADAWTTFCAGRKAWGYVQDQMPSTHPIAGGRADADPGARELRRDQLRQGCLGAPAAGRATLGRAAVLGRHPRLPGRARLGQRHAGRPAGRAGGRARAGPGHWSRAWLQTAGPNTLRPRVPRSAPTARSRVRGAAGGAGGASHAAAASPRGRPVLPLGRPAAPVPTSRPGARGWRWRARAPRCRELAGVRAAGPDPAQRRGPRLRGRPVRPAVAANPDRGGRRARRPLARAVCWSAAIDMAAPGRAAAAHVRAACWRAAWAARGLGRGAAGPALRDRADHDAGRRPGMGARGQGASSPRPGPGCCVGAEPGSDHQLAWAQLLELDRGHAGAARPDRRAAGRHAPTCPAWPWTPSCAGRCCAGSP